MPKQKKNTSNLDVEMNENRDELLVALSEELNKANKDGGKVAFFLDEQEDPSSIKTWVSTGSSMLDVAISNRANGGLPAGRCVELQGLESCVTPDTKIKVIIE